MDNILLLIEAPFLSVQAILDGIIIGALFSLAAYGMALVWGVMRIINIAQGEFVILGGYVAYFLYEAGIHPMFGIPVAGVVLFVVGYGLYKVVIYRVVDKDLFISLLATFGLSILIQQLMNIMFGADVQIAEAGFGTSFMFDYNVTIPHIRIVTFIVSAFLGALLVIYIKRSRLGQAIRATAQNARAARVMGIDTDHVYAMTFSLNAAICGATGALVAMTFAIHPYIGLPYTIRSFMIVIMAGLGNLPGVIAAGTGIGVAEQFADYIFGAEFRMAFIFLLLVAFLVWRGRMLARKREVLK
ncbi:MAG: branched-chain amino acid ABC transporter permease [SAR324 cluster bacterium]|nr:branched-chain amino acid ABC transporter permease [SAR324 cluster bacterium]MBL7035266.1 branched-chain amino acid ABC transporter permease [SAR324 cluster bacterium]